MKNKFAILSHILPPSPSGQAVMLQRLLSDFSAEDYCLLSTENYLNRKKYKTKELLPGKYYHLKSYPNNRLLYLLSNLYINLMKRADDIQKIILKENCQILIACSGNIFDLPAAYIAAKREKIRLIIYLFDDYAYQWPGIYGVFARLVLKRAVRYSSKIIVPNEFLQKEYLKKYHYRAEIIRNPVATDLENLKYDFDKKYLNIIYTGAIYDANADAILNLIEAIKIIKNYPIRLNLFTAQPKKELNDKHILGPDFVIYHHHLEQKYIMSIQKKADILFLPLAFNSPYPQIINTSAPGKMGEYLFSGKPILVHAPKDSFINWYFKKNKCGLVVKEENRQKLAQAIIKLIKNKKLQQNYSLIGKKCAKRDFDLNTIRTTFMKLITSIGASK